MNNNDTGSLRLNMLVDYLVYRIVYRYTIHGISNCKLYYTATHSQMHIMNYNTKNTKSFLIVKNLDQDMPILYCLSAPGLV